jgi:hypothetical protein
MTEAQRQLLLKVVLGVAAVGHLIVGLSFWFWPDLAIEEILAWGNPSGWTSVLGAYDIAVAYGMFMAFRNPDLNGGLIRFGAALLTIHAGTHAYYLIWGDSPQRLWIATGYLLLGAVLLAWLSPRPQTAEVLS